MEIRLNKYISDSGYCSRREADRLIETGKVYIGKRIATVGDKVKRGEIVRVNGHKLAIREDYVYIALNKPAGITSTTDPTDPTNIVKFINYPTRIFNIGRLDKDSEGLILLTDNGDIVNKILRAGNNHEKEYEVTVDKSIDNEFVKRMSKGVRILGTVTKECQVIKEGDKNFRIILTQGLNRQIRRMCEVLGYNVTRLRRVRIMNITLKKLPLEQWRFLEDSEMKILLDSIKDSDGEEQASKIVGKAKRPKSHFHAKRNENTINNDKPKNRTSNSSRLGKPKQTNTFGKSKTHSKTKSTNKSSRGKRR